MSLSMNASAWITTFSLIQIEDHHSTHGQSTRSALPLLYRPSLGRRTGYRLACQGIIRELSGFYFQGHLNEKGVYNTTLQADDRA